MLGRIDKRWQRIKCVGLLDDVKYASKLIIKFEKSSLAYMNWVAKMSKQAAVLILGCRGVEISALTFADNRLLDLVKLLTTKLSYHRFACINYVLICAEIVLVKFIDFLSLWYYMKLPFMSWWKISDFFPCGWKLSIYVQTSPRVWMLRQLRENSWRCCSIPQLI